MASPYTGEARYRLVGRPDDVAPFVRVARVMLTELSDDMARNNRKTGVLRRSFHVGTDTEGVVGRARIQVNWNNGQAELKIVVDRETSNPKQEKEEKERKPYLWVGVRHKFLNGVEGFYPMYGIYVTEPGENGILHDPEFTWWNQWYEFDGGTLEDMNLEKQDGYWKDQSPPWNVKPGRYYYSVGDCESMFFTKNLMRCYRGISFRKACLGNSRIEEAHDPTLTPEAAASVAASRNWPDEELNYTRLPWDTVVVLDPDEGGADPTSRRESDLEVVKILAEATGTPGTGRVLPGLYAINILDAEDSCWLEQPPLDLLVEVRVNKAPYTITKQFDVTIGYGSWDWENVVPFGSEEQRNQCISWGGPNKRRECWWPSTIMVDVIGGAISLSDHSPDWFEPSGGPVARNCSKYNTVVLVGLVAPWGMGFVDPTQFDETMRNMACGMRYFISGSMDLRCTDINTAEWEAMLRTVFAPNKYTIALVNFYTKEIQEVSFDVPELNPTSTGSCTGRPWENYYRIRTRAFNSNFGKYIYGACGPTFNNQVYAGDPAIEPCATWVDFATLLGTL